MVIPILVTYSSTSPFAEPVRRKKIANLAVPGTVRLGIFFYRLVSTEELVLEYVISMRVTKVTAEKNFSLNIWLSYITTERIHLFQNYIVFGTVWLVIFFYKLVSTEGLFLEYVISMGVTKVTPEKNFCLNVWFSHSSMARIHLFQNYAV